VHIDSTLRIQDDAQRAKGPQAMGITAIVLAGGQGSRMNHRDKAWVNHAGSPLIHHVIEQIRASVDDIVISRNRPHPGYDALGYTCVSDILEDFQGPLAGVLSCVPHIATDLALIVPCDTPNLPLELTERLLAGKGSARVAVAAHDDKIEPLIFLAETAVLESIRDYLDSGRRSVMGWHELHPFNEVSFGEGTACFENINRVSQLRI